MNDNKVGIIIFSRMNSSRLPGKAMMNIGDFTLLERVIRRAKLLDYPVILSTTEMAIDDVLVELANKLKIPTYRGSENNVLERAVLTAKKFDLVGFARLCGDRPFFSIKELDSALKIFIKSSNQLDLITNNLFNRALKGLTTEVINSSTITELLNNNPNKEEKEHITSMFYNKPELFNIYSISPNYKSKFNANGFAVDTDDDLKIMNQFIERNPELTFEIS